MSEAKQLPPSRIYWAITNPNRVRRTPGRDGIQLKGKVLRVPRDIGQDLDVLIETWEMACQSDSPRYHFAKQFLTELRELLPLKNEV